MIWEFCGDPIDDELLDQLLLVATDDATLAPLRTLLDPLELQALRARAERLIDAGVFPDLSPRRNIPYGW